MKGTQKRKTGKSGFELIEEATHVLRGAPVSILLTYHLGAIPFVLGFLFFWAEMSRSPFADQHLAETALAMAALFLWMKHWQAVFSRQIRASLRAETAPALSLRQHLRISLAQIIIQPSGLLLLPLSAIPLALPLPWVIAFYQNTTALADSESADVGRLFKNAWRQASLWPMQNHVILSLMAVFGGCVFVNCCIAAATIPVLVKMLFGIETVFTQSPLALLNTTFFMSMMAVCYLCIDPILKVAYALRCFYGESLQSGEDLKAELKRFSRTPQKLAAVLLMAFVLTANPNVQASEPATPAPAPAHDASGISPAELDRQISEVIKERKYAWRMPREESPPDEGEPGMITKFFRDMMRMFRDAVRSGLEWLNDFIRRLLNRKAPGHGGDSGSWIVTQQFLLFALVAAVLVALALLLMRTWRRKRVTMAVATNPVQPAPDLTDENVGADQLPEDGWTRLGRELLERGEYRLAMRAFYLASLAHLAQRNLISLARFKSNRDYANELRKRAHALPNLLPVFGDNLSVFERIWYGMHEVNRELVNEFAANVEKIRTA